MHTKKITIIGAGTMGSTIIAGLIRTGNSTVENITATVRTERTAKKIRSQYGVEVFTDNVKASQGADIIILSVKPKNITKVLEGLKNGGIFHQNPLIISIAAGVSIGSIEDVTTQKIPVIRAMPNTPCLIGAGVTAIAPGRGAEPEHMAQARIIFESLGTCVEVEEQHMDAVTGLAASGPAYIYLIIEALADGGVMMGLPRKVAMDLVTQMVAGSARMVAETSRHPASLKDDVTTPAGCTISGILTLEDGKIRSVLARAVQIATIRASELGHK